MKEGGGNYVAANGKERFQLEDMEQEVDSDDSKDSDAVQLFELPKRKLVRPMSSALRRKVRPPNQCWKTTKECCRVFVTVTLPMLIAIFIVSTILCLTFLLVGIAGMKQELSMLKLRLRNVDAAEQNFIGKKEQLRKQFQNKLNDIISYQTELLGLKNTVKRLSLHIHKLNKTVHKYHDQPTTQVSSKLSVLQHDIDTIKTGMADTGADIEKLKATGKQLQKDVGGLTKQMDTSKHKMYNMTVKISQIEHKPPPPLVTTPKTLVVTMIPDQDKPPTRKELKSILAESEKKQIGACKKEVSLYGIKLELLRNETLHMNETYFNEISYLQHYISTIKSTEKIPVTNVTTTLHVSNTTIKNSTAKPISPPSHTAGINDTSPSITTFDNDTSNVTPTKVVGVNSTHASLISTQLVNTTQSSVNHTVPTTSLAHTEAVNRTTKRSVDTTAMAPSSTDKPVNTTRSDKLEAIKADEILEKYEAQESDPTKKKNIGRIKPLLQEYIRRTKSKTNKELDKLDAGNSA